MNSAVVDKVNQLDRSVLISVQSLRSPVVTKVFLFLTYTGVSRAWFSAAILLNILHLSGIRFAARQEEILRSLLCPLASWVVSYAVKSFFSRTRPSELIPGYSRITDSPVCKSFPSAHAASTMAFFAGLAVLSHPWAPFVGVWAVLVSFSRLYLGVHYLTDILGGALLGAAISFLLWNLGAL